MIVTTIMPNTYSPLSYNRMYNSIMDQRISSEQKIEIQGSYWPRVRLLHPVIGSKKEGKTVHKSMKPSMSIKKNKKFISTSEKWIPVTRVPCEELSSKSLLERLQDVPCLISSKGQEQQQCPRSPITGKVFSSTTTTSPTRKNTTLTPTTENVVRRRTSTQLVVRTTIQGGLIR